MDAIGSGQRQEAAARGRWPRRRVVAAAGSRPDRCLALAVALVAADFLWFVHQMPATEAAPARNADGIVALTGGPFRINDALDLLAAGRGKRLLISGVNPATRRGRNLAPDARASSAGSPAASISIIPPPTPSATPSRRGAGSKARGFQSLIVVTANFHMPRAMVELAHELPDVALVPYGVVSEKVRVEAWWENPETARLLFLEYLKYIVARVRLWLPSSFE